MNAFHFHVFPFQLNAVVVFFFYTSFCLNPSQANKLNRMDKMLFGNVSVYLYGAHQWHTSKHEQFSITFPSSNYHNMIGWICRFQCEAIFFLTIIYLIDKSTHFVYLLYCGKSIIYFSCVGWKVVNDIKKNVLSPRCFTTQIRFRD